MRYLYIILLFFIASCSEKIEKSNIISVSIEPLKFFVDNISGNDFEVNVLVPKGASAEMYEPTPLSIKKITKSKAFISVALLDTEINIINYLKNRDDILNVQLYKNCHTIESDGCCAHNHSSENSNNNQSNNHIHKGVDPHIWMSVNNSKKIAETILNALIMLNKDSSEKYTTNYTKFIAELDKVDSTFKSKSNKINTVLVYHPFLAYLAEEYNFKQIAIEDEGKEPTAMKMKNLIEMARKDSINRIFYQSQFPTNSVESISKELGIVSVKIDPLEYNHISNLINIANSISYE